MSNVSPDEHLAEVLASFAGCPDPRLRAVLQALVRHAHAFVREVRPSLAEWMAGIQYLTEVGQLCSDTRQEFILFSDTLGVSMLVEMLNQGGPEGATEPTVLGPFYVAGAPHRALGETISLDGAGEPLSVSGSVRGVDGTPIPGAELDVWQAAPNGCYDIQDPAQPPMNLRGVFTADQRGQFWFRTVRPTPYPIPHDGPVGRMLRATGRSYMRPAHIHFKVTAPGFRPIVTHVFDAASEHLTDDAVFGVRDSLVVPMEPDPAGSLATTFDVVLDRADPSPSTVDGSG
jgi:hydroxyquinol 1,2-dioxygenase